jgi:hypothetical protein
MDANRKVGAGLVLACAYVALPIWGTSVYTQSPGGWRRTSGHVVSSLGYPTSGAKIDSEPAHEFTAASL